MSRSSQLRSGRSTTKSAPRNPPNNTTNTRKKRSRRRGRAVATILRAPLSHCALLYAKALIDPFGLLSTGELPCIPDLVEVPSYKFSVLQRGQFSVGAGGFGFLLVNPRINGNGQAILSTDPTFVGSSMPGTLPLPAGVQYVNSVQFPWAVGGKVSRTVGCGVRIRYSGTELNRGGTIVQLGSEFGSETLWSGKTLSQLMAYPSATVAPVTRAWHTITWRPSHPNYMEYSDGNFELGQAGNPTNPGALLFFVAASATVLFDYEVVWFTESISYGSKVVPSTSRSHSDTGGMSMVRDFLGSIPFSSVGPMLMQGFLKYASARAAQSPVLQYQTGPTVVEL